MKSIAAGIVLLVLAAACVLFGLTFIMAGHGGAIVPLISWLAYAVAVVLAVFGVVELLYRIGRVLCRA